MRFSFTSISRSEACSGVGLNKFTDFVCTAVLVDKRHFRNPILDVSRLIPSIILFLFTSYKYFSLSFNVYFFLLHNNNNNNNNNFHLNS